MPSPLALTDSFSNLSTTPLTHHPRTTHYTNTERSKTNTEITWGITLVLMFRSVGSILFGIAADRYGRKWPFIVNNILFIILELVSPLARLFGPEK
jgi:MFS family permease